MENKQEKIITYAKKTLIAMKNPYDSVEKVYPNILDETLKNEKFRYMGVKNRIQIPMSFIKMLYLKGGYLLHTLDKASYKGRAVDVRLTNPMTGRWMSGSSSGTAINVRLGINDIGVGTDGGGSVLAPAMALQLYGFISPLFAQNDMQTYSSVSTDGIAFHASIGFISASYEELKRVLNCALTMPLPQKHMTITLDNKLLQEITISHRYEVSIPTFKKRTDAITFLTEQLASTDILITKEGPIDLEGFGDSVLGHFDDYVGQLQLQSQKNIIKVVNMIGASAMVLPAKEFGCGYIWIMKSEPAIIATALALANDYIQDEDILSSKYFANFETYFPREFNTQDFGERHE